MTRRVALATGGTAGDVRPALAVAQAYRESVPDAEIIIVGSSTGFEAEMATANGYAFELIESLPIARVGGGARAQALRRFLAGIREARQMMNRRQVQLAIGFGGYASASTVVAAHGLGIATAIVECNARPGLANWMLSPFAKLVFLGFAECQRYFPLRRTVVCGVPILFEREGPTRPVERSRRLLVLGGSLGSIFLNRHAPELIAALARRGMAFEVLHQCGAGHERETADFYRRFGATGTVEPFIDDIASAYQWADFALASAGASTLAELAAAGIPALIVPDASAAWNHQQANARAYAHTSSIPWTTEREWCTESLADTLAPLLTDAQRLTQASDALLAMRYGHAPAMVVEHCERLLHHA